MQMLPKTLILVPLLAVGCGITAASAPVIEAQCADQPRPGADPRWQAPGSFLVLEDRDARRPCRHRCCRQRNVLSAAGISSANTLGLLPTAVVASGSAADRFAAMKVYWNGDGGMFALFLSVNSVT